MLFVSLRLHHRVNSKPDTTLMKLSNMIQAIDLHACGEPGRVIVGGVLDVPGNTMFEKMRYLATKADHLRKRMLNEPRGYPALCCNLILPPTHPEADAGYVIMEHVEYPGMSGSNTICVATALLETGMIPMQEPISELTLEAPAGLIRITAECRGGKVQQVTFSNVPAFATHLDASVEVPHLGTVQVDVAYGGMFYVIAEAAQFGLALTPDEGRDIVRIGEMVKAAAREVWKYFIQRELCGVRDQRDVIREYRIPQEVLMRLGAMD